MSTPSPLQPQGALDGVTPPKSRLRITVLSILGLHVVFIGGLLLQGCDKGGRQTATNDSPTNTTSSLPSLSEVGSTNSFYTSYPGDTPAGGGAGATAGGAAAPLGSGAGGIPGPTYPTGTSSNYYAGTTAGTGLGSGTGTLPPPTTDYGQGLGTGAPGFGSSTGGVGSSPVTGATTEHIIKSGDVIRDLAKKYGVTEQAILAANPNVKPRSLKVNDKILIPAPTHAANAAAPSTGTGGAATAATEPAAPAGGEVYIVKAGDNLTKVAKKFGVTVKQIRDANGLKSDRLTVKQRLVIPAKSGAGQKASAAAGGASPSI